jgi:hypothetical protein
MGRAADDVAAPPGRPRSQSGRSSPAGTPQAGGGLGSESPGPRAPPGETPPPVNRSLEWGASPVAADGAGDLLATPGVGGVSEAESGGFTPADPSGDQLEAESGGFTPGPGLPAGRRPGSPEGFEGSAGFADGGASRGRVCH